MSFPFAMVEAYQRTFDQLAEKARTVGLTIEEIKSPIGMSVLHSLNDDRPKVTLPPWLTIPTGWEASTLREDGRIIYLRCDGAAFRWSRRAGRIVFPHTARRLSIPATAEEFRRACAYLGGRFAEFLPTGRPKACVCSVDYRGGPKADPGCWACEADNNGWAEMKP